MKKSAKLWIIIAIVFIIFLCVIAFCPRGEKESPPSGYTFIRDDAMAALYQPSFYCPPGYGSILAIYYRAAKDESGTIHIAYHPLWARERNDAKAWGAFLSRWLYTGGLSLQRAMFGKGDIETIGLTIDPSEGTIIQIDYETAADYDPRSFSVKHLNVIKTGRFKSPLRFSVVSWNHLFSLDGKVPASLNTPASTIPLAYFTPELWSKYAIWKNPETLLRKDRAHFVWERGVAP
ncbi:MAG: hypothetical protein WC820_06135 [Spirochaetales bacterium]|jgi:hypothetical protein